MKKFVSILSVFVIVTFYVVQYGEHSTRICEGDFCYSIYCPSGTCSTKGKTTICVDKDCIQEILTKNGTEHLTGVWEVTWDDVGISAPTVRKLDVVKKYVVE